MDKILTPKEEKMLNELAAMEKTAANTYEYFSNCMKSKGLFGADKFYFAESRNEHEHYARIAKFMNDLGCEVAMPDQDAIDMPDLPLGKTLEVAYKMEKDLLMKYSQMYDAGRPFIKNFVNEFLTIQTESVGEYGDLINRFKFVGDNVLLFDQELGK